MRQEYTYAVARVRCREPRLLTDSDLSMLLTAADSDAVLRLLRDKGWGSGASEQSAADVLRSEDEKLWAFIGEIVPDRDIFSFLLVPNDYHNLKAAVKAITRDLDPKDLFMYDSVYDPEKLYSALKRREYDELPEELREVARQAVTALLETSDGQLCDVIIDKACMERVTALGKAQDNEMIRMYCELFTAASDIRIAVRAARTGKSREFVARALAECDTLDVSALATAAALGYDDIIDYLERTDYKGAVPALQSSLSAFEKWCDDHMTQALKTQKWEPFTIGPVVAYMIARQNEIKAVRMILSAKLNGLPEQTIRERLRMMYV